MPRCAVLNFSFNLQSLYVFLHFHWQINPYSPFKLFALLLAVYILGDNILFFCAGKKISLTCTHFYNALNGCYGT